MQRSVDRKCQQRQRFRGQYRLRAEVSMSSPPGVSCHTCCMQAAGLRRRQDAMANQTVCSAVSHRAERRACSRACRQACQEWVKRSRALYNRHRTGYGIACCAPAEKVAATIAVRGRNCHESRGLTQNFASTILPVFTGTRNVARTSLSR